MRKSPYILILIVLLAMSIFSEVAPLFNLGSEYFHISLFSGALRNMVFTATCLGGIFAYLFLLPLDKKELAVATCIGIAAEILLSTYRSPNVPNFNRFLLIGPGLLVGCLLVVLWRIWRTYQLDNSEKLKTELEVLSIMLCMPVFFSLGGAIRLYDYHVYDPHFYALDSLWGCQISFIITKYLRSNLFVLRFMDIIYFYLPLWMVIAQIIVYKDNITHHRKHNHCLVPAYFFILIAIGGSLSYAFLPAVGIQLYCGTNLFPNGPWPAASMNPQTIEAPYYLYRNCMPSLHFAWILAVYYSLYRAKTIYKNMALVLVFLTVMSAFSVGCHYVIDLIMSVPFCLTFLAIVINEAPLKMRLLSSILGAVATMSWFYLIKYHTTSLLHYPQLTLFSLIFTDLASFALIYMLYRQGRDLGESTKQTQA